MFDMWSSVTSKLEAQTQIQTNIQQTTLQNSSSGSIKGKDEGLLESSHLQTQRFLLKVFKVQWMGTKSVVGTKDNKEGFSCSVK